MDLQDGIVTKKDVQDYSYNFTVNGCTTGDQAFSSLDSMCEGLKNDSLNNYCAYDLRRSKFDTDCFGRGTW